MAWEPISLNELLDLVRAAEEQLTEAEARLWGAMRTPPEKWQQTPWGDEGGGFWVVGVIGRNVTWYNDIEEGFQHAPYTAYGTIDDYRCDQDQLCLVIQRLNMRLAG